MRTNSKGFTVVEALLIVVIVGVVGFVGYKVMQVRKNSSASTASSPVTTKPTPQIQPSTAPEVKKASDLDAASKELDKLNVESELGEASKLQSDVNAL